MRKSLLVLTAIILTVSGFAQKSADIGIWGGSSTYMGDMKETPLMQTFNLNFGAFFRYNFNSRIALRTQFLTGKFSAEGMLEDQEWAFDKNAQDISVMAEINYLKYILGEKKTLFTPYIMGGVGVMYFPYIISYSLDDVNGDYYPILLNPKNNREYMSEKNRESIISSALLFGFGVKFAIGSRLGFGIEYQIRKLINDKFDDLDDPLSFETVDNNGNAETIKYTDFLHNNDWPGYLGVNVTYKIDLDRKACPAYDRKHW